MAKKLSKVVSTKNSCNRCGFCCMSADLILGEITQHNLEEWKDKARWLNLHRCDTSTRTKDGRTFFSSRIPFLCANLDIDLKTHKYFCKDYKNRPKTCRDFACTMIKKTK